MRIRFENITRKVVLFYRLIIIYVLIKVVYNVYGVVSDLSRNLNSFYISKLGDIFIKYFTFPLKLKIIYLLIRLKFEIVYKLSVWK